MRRAVGTANKHVGSSRVLVLTETEEALMGGWMKRICEGDFACQNPGTTNCLPKVAAKGPPPCTA